eukprot:g56467.t1
MREERLYCPHKSRGDVEKRLREGFSTSPRVFWAVKPDPFLYMSVTVACGRFAACGGEYRYHLVPVLDSTGKTPMPSLLAAANPHNAEENAQSFGALLSAALLLWILTLLVPYGVIRFWMYRKYFPVRGRSKESCVVLVVCVSVMIGFRQVQLLADYPGLSCKSSLIVNGLVCNLITASLLLGAWTMYRKYKLTSEFTSLGRFRNSVQQTTIVTADELRASAPADSEIVNEELGELSRHHSTVFLQKEKEEGKGKWRNKDEDKTKLKRQAMSGVRGSGRGGVAHWFQRRRQLSAKKRKEYFLFITLIATIVLVLAETMLGGLFITEENDTSTESYCINYHYSYVMIGLVAAQLLAFFLIGVIIRHDKRLEDTFDIWLETFCISQA